MKKIFLLAAAFAFSYTLIAQSETKSQSQAETRKQLEAKKLAKDQPVPVKTTAEVKPELVQTQSQVSPDNMIKVNTENHDFGKIPKGTPVTYSFEIKNISAKPVVLENVSTSCGCTTPEWDKKPILPGTTSKIKVGYNAANVGPFNKSINITLAGIAQPKTVTIVGEVLAPAEPPKEIKSNN